MKKGFTFIETLLVIAIISSLSIFGMMKISAFQKDAKIDSISNELLSTLKLARSKSELGEIPNSMVLDDFLPGKLPSYGVRSAGSGYEVFVSYETSLGPVSNSVNQVNSVPNEMGLSSFGVVFERLSGKTSDTEISILYKGVPEKKVVVNSSGYFSIKDP